MIAKKYCYTITLTVDILPRIQKKMIYNVIASTELDAVGVVKQIFLREEEYAEETISNYTVDDKKEVWMIC